MGALLLEASEVVTGDVVNVGPWWSEYANLTSKEEGVECLFSSDPLKVGTGVGASVGGNLYFLLDIMEAWVSKGPL